MKVHWVYKDEIVDCDDYWAVLSLYETEEEGYTKGFEILENIGIDEVNKHKYYVSFKCNEVKYEGI